jgi:hypothetical protein
MLNFNTVSAANPKSRLQPRAEALLSPVSSYGSINQPLTGTHSQSSTTSSIFFPSVENQVSAVSKDTQGTPFIEIPEYILNHIADFLGYNDTLKGLLPTSKKLFVKVMNDNFIIRMNMLMPNKTILTHEACYVDLKKMQMEELKRQIDTKFGSEIFEILDRLGSHYWQGGMKFGALTFLILFTSYMLIVYYSGLYSDSDSVSDKSDSTQMLFFALGSIIAIAAISSTVGALCSKPNASKLKENIESVPKSKCFRRQADETNPSIRVRLRSSCISAFI